MRVGCRIRWVGEKNLGSLGKKFRRTLRRAGLAQLWLPAVRKKNRKAQGWIPEQKEEFLRGVG